MKINGMTKLYGLIGNPVAHTLSPLLHNTLAEKMGHDMVYTAFPVSEGKVGDAVRGALALGIAGMNVTAPYKSAVIPFLKTVDPKAIKLGGINTLVREEDDFIGYNTDNIGLKLAMKSEGMEIAGSDILLIGAGAAARAAAYLCASEKASRIFIINRSIDKAKNLASEIHSLMNLNCIVGGLNDFSFLPTNNLIAIQSTNIGMYPRENEILITDPAFYDRIKAGIDMIYNPMETLFMKNIHKAGGKAINGLKMLLYQGIASYELWNGEIIPSVFIDMVYEELLYACRK